MGKANFSAEEWPVVAKLPLHAAAFVVASAPHSGIGTARDMLAAAAELVNRHGGESGNLLVSDAASDTPASGDPGPTKHSDENLERLRAAITSAVALVDAKAGADGPGYKTAAYRVAEVAARTSGDGFLSIGGEKVNDDERAALAWVHEALGLA
ncbi:hypothetical protein [Agromyces sp. Marseille-Q5079]|uniref:hypothetical protein n=1 Tax=Agromyces sp. Marseille-Q5079 TaxID=3439059 RepID=UPI003D9C9694